MLLDKFNSLRLQNEGSIAEYIKKINELQLALKKVGHDISVIDLVERMLGFLPLSYELVYQQVSAMIAILDLDNMTARLLEAEACLRFCQTSTGISPTNVDALAAKLECFPQRPPQLQLGFNRRPPYLFNAYCPPQLSSFSLHTCKWQQLSRPSQSRLPRACLGDGKWSLGPAFLGRTRFTPPKFQAAWRCY